MQRFKVKYSATIVLFCGCASNISLATEPNANDLTEWIGASDAFVAGRVEKVTPYVVGEQFQYIRTAYTICGTTDDCTVVGIPGEPIPTGGSALRVTLEGYKHPTEGTMAVVFLIKGDDEVAATKPSSAGPGRMYAPYSGQSVFVAPTDDGPIGHAGNTIPSSAALIGGADTETLTYQNLVEFINQQGLRQLSR